MVAATVAPAAPATMTIEEAAGFLGISRWLAYELARTGELPTVRLGKRRLLVPRAALDRMLEGAGERTGGAATAGVAR